MILKSYLLPHVSIYVTVLQCGCSQVDGKAGGAGGGEEKAKLLMERREDIIYS